MECKTGNFGAPKNPSHSHTLPTNTVYPFNNATQLTEIRERAREQILERERKKLVVLKCNKLESRLNKRKVNKSIRKWEKLLITHKDVRTRGKRNKKTCLKQMKRSRTKQESVLTEYLREIVVGESAFPASYRIVIRRGQAASPHKEHKA